MKKLIISSKRVGALDFVKGCCVIGMIAHHTLDYFANGSILYKYVRFITGSFIFLTGFLVTNIYLKKYDIIEEKNKISYRLASRGTKIIILFSALNIAIKLIVDQTINLKTIESSDILSSLYTVFLIGNYKIVAFELLIPISYTLFITAFMIFMLREKILLIVPLSMFLFIYCSYYFFIQIGAYNLRYVTIGLLGAAFGFIPIKKYNILSKYWHIAAVIYITHLIIITFTKLFYPIYVLNILCNLMFLYILGKKFITRNILVDNIILVGNYTLFSYLFQILFLQLISRIMSYTYLTSSLALIGFIATLFFTILSVQLLNHYRETSITLSKFYKIVFS